MAMKSSSVCALENNKKQSGSNDMGHPVGTEIFKIEEEMAEKMRHKFANPPLQKWAEFTAHNMQLLMSLCIFTTCNESKTCSICW